MRRKGTAKLIAVGVSMIILAFTLQATVTENGARREDKALKTIHAEYIQTEEPPIIQEPQEKPELPVQETETVSHQEETATDDEILLKIAMAEAEGESIEGKALVMLVVMNRVASNGFPGTVEEVVFQDRQFSVMEDGGRYYTTTPDEDCKAALELVKSGWDESDGALYFESGDGDGWHSRNLEFLFRVGGHKFYR